MRQYQKVPLWVMILCLVGFNTWAAGPKQNSVQVKQGIVRAKPSFLGPVMARLAYGTRVTVKLEQGPWSQIQIPGSTKAGWISTSSITAKRIVLVAGKTDVKQAASSDEVALAGKGFNKQVEKSYRSQNPDMDFKWVDKMETFVVSEAQMRKFLKDGRVLPQGGAQ